MNSNSLPVALMQSLVMTIHQDLAWDSEDSKEQVRASSRPQASCADVECAHRSSAARCPTSSCSRPCQPSPKPRVYSADACHSGLIARWSFGVSLLRASDDRPSPLPSPIDDPGPLPPSDSPTSPLLGERPRQDLSSTSSLPSRVRNNTNQYLTPPRKNPSVTRLNGSEGRQGPVYHSFPNTPRWRTPTPSVGTPSRGGSDSEDEDEGDDGTTTERAEDHNDDDDGEETPSLAKLQARQDRMEWGGFRRGELGAKAKKKSTGPAWPRMRKAGRWVKRMYRLVASFMTPPLCVPASSSPCAS